MTGQTTFAVRCIAMWLCTLPAAVFAQQPPYDVFPAAEPPYYRVRYEASSEEGELRFAVNYTIWIPSDVETLRGIIVHQHGCGEGSCKSGLTGAFDLHWQALARKHECALLAPAYEQPEMANCQLWCDPRNGSDGAFQRCLVDLGARSGHPELAKVPWALWGHSGGGHWAGGIVLLHPDRVVAAWLRSGVPLLKPNPDRPTLKAHSVPTAALQVPILCNLGTKEGVTEKEGRFAAVWPANEAFFGELRSKGGLIGVAIDPLTSHECGNQRYLAIPWLDACLSARLPKISGQPLRPMPADSVWLAMPTEKEASPATNFGGDASKAAWLPSEAIARLWMQYVKDTAVADTTPPPAPTDLRISGNELTWRAAADLESGLAGFIIERDGQFLARIPAEGKNPFGRPIFQNLQYSDTPTQPLVPLRFTDATAEPGKKHTYRVIAVNTAGLKSDPAAGGLPRSSPEAQGVSSSALLAFVEAADRQLDSLHSFMLVRHGHVVAEGWWAPYHAAAPHSLYSLSKSFTSTAVGLAIEEGNLRLDDPVLKFFPEDAPAEPTSNLKAMRVSDLLRMSTGQQTEPPRAGDQVWTKAFLSHPVAFKPGTHFLYNTSATYMLSAIVQKTTGQRLIDYLQPRLFGPLGIENPTWETSPQGIDLGGYGLSVRTEDIARFGQLYLQKGKWQGKPLLPDSWVEAATARQTSNGSNPQSDWDQGYGYQFWRCRHGAYRGDGAFGQFCVVLPEQDAVIAITSGVRNMQAVLDLVWDKLLPALAPSPLPANAEMHQKLQLALARLSLRIPEAASSSPKDQRAKTYVFAANDRKLQSLSLETNAEKGPATLIARIDGAEQRIVCGRDSWQRGQFHWGWPPQHSAAACGAWTADDTFTAKVCFYETPFITTIRLKFEGDAVRVESETNVGFGSTRQAEIVGKAE